MKRAVIYARVSSKRQADEGISMDAQIEQCSARAGQLGAAVVRVFRDDGVSGRSTKGRHGFASALAYCKQGDVDYFVVWSTSRFARNVVDLWVYQDQLKEAGTRLECLNGDIDDETDAGFINKVFMGAMDQMASRQIGRDTLKSMKASAAEGYFTGGRVPFGYQPVKDGKRTRIEPHPLHAELVKRAFQIALEDRLGVQAVAQRMNEAGLTRDGKPWGKNTMNYLLKNTVYTGVKTFNRFNKKAGKPKPRDQWVQVQAHPGLVSMEDFEKVQAMMEMRTPHDKATSSSSCFVFTGLLACGICGGPLQITNGTSRNGTLYSYYGCMAHKRGAPRCLFKKQRAEKFDDWLLGEILARVMTPDVVAHAMADLGSRGAEWVRDRELARALLVKDVRDVEGRRARLYEVLETEGRAAKDLGHISDRIRELSGQLQQLHIKLAKLEAEPMPGPMPKIDPAIALEVMKEVVQTGDPKKKRAFLGAFIHKVAVTTAEAIVDYKPDALVRIGHDLTTVRSKDKWLPVQSKLRTKRLRLPRPCSVRDTGSRADSLSSCG